MGDFFTHNILRKYVAGFGSLFKDYTVRRYDTNNVLQKNIEIPLTIGTKKKFYYLLKQYSDDPRVVGIMIPRITYILTDCVRQPQRQRNAINKYLQTSALSGYDSSLLSVFEPVPYDLTFEVSIWAKTYHDMYQIVEQILPEYKPQKSIAINLLPTVFKTNSFDTNVVLVGSKPDFQNDLKNETGSVQTIIWNLTYNVEAWLFPRISDTSVIKKVYTNIFDYNENLSEVPTDPMVEIDQFVDPIESHEDDEYMIKLIQTSSEGTVEKMLNKDE